MSIKINPQAKYVYLSTDQGWTKVVAHIVEIDGIKYTFAPMWDKKLCFVVSELRSGSKIVDYPINKLQFLAADTKEKFIDILQESAEVLQPLLKLQIEKIKQESANLLKDHKYKFGPMPEITDCNDLGV